jgi:hypothetical protein
MATLLKVLNNLADIKSAGVLHFASELRLRCSNVLFAREEQRNVDRHAPESGFLDRRNALLGSRNLDEKVGPACSGMKGTRGLDKLRSGHRSLAAIRMNDGVALTAPPKSAPS